MKKWLFTFLLLIVFPAMATHIVGGEFELLYLSPNHYQLNLIVYFDKKNGDPGALDQQLTASIFRKRDQRFMMDVLMNLNTRTPVGYAQPECSNGEIQTDKIYYSTDINLSDALFNDSEGYFVVWQRCCRNYNITNIFSSAPQSSNDPNTAGQTFYLEFPPVVKDGASFINSSPRLFPPLNDYACTYRPYYVDFAGVDDDGDSLVYSMVTPWNTVTTTPLPAESPGPYPDVHWKPGFSLTNILYGAPDLRITTDGLLTCTATRAGLYVFAVQVLQYRNKQVIGLSRRDFQMLVVDDCPSAGVPQIVGIKDAITYQNTMAVTFDYTTPDNARCITVRVSDPDTQSPAAKFTQTLTIRAVALNFNKKNLTSILPAVRTTTLTHGATADFSICFPSCPFINGPMQIGIIVADQTCALPLTDTLRMTVNIQPPPNTPPFFTSPTPVNVTLNEGGSGTWPFEAHDNENDSMLLYMTTDGFNLAAAGMTLTTQVNQKGKVSGILHWDAFCNIFDFTKKTSYQVTLMVDDMDLCAFDKSPVAMYNLTVKLPGVADPIIDTDLTPDPAEVVVDGLTRKIDETLAFKVTATQAEGDYLVLREVGPGLKAKGANFLPTSGDSLVNADFKWDIRCNNVNPKVQDHYAFTFVVVDTANWCRLIKTDTVTVKVKVLPPDNAPPVIVIEDQQATLLVNNTLSSLVGEPIFLNVVGTDADVFPAPDSLVLKLIKADGSVPPDGYRFDNKDGKISVVSPFTWDPKCDVFKNGVSKNDYTFVFTITDNRCYNSKSDTVTLALNIHDVAKYTRSFSPGNVITPNGDGCNDYFAVEGIDSSNPECFLAAPDENIALPKDDCAGVFQFVRIHNRWGKLVFESTARNFRWQPVNESSGEYFYLIKFTNSEFKGVVSVR